jgi:hypothetical protein
MYRHYQPNMRSYFAQVQRTHNTMLVSSLFKTCKWQDDLGRSSSLFSFNTTPPILRWRGNVFIVLLSNQSNQSYVTTEVSQLVCLLRPDFYYCQTVAGLLMWGALSEKRAGLPFTIAAGLRQRSHSWVRVFRDSWPYFIFSDSRLPQLGGPGTRIFIHQEQGGPVTPPGTGFPFRRLLRLAGLRWRHSKPPPHGYRVIYRFSFYKTRTA